MLMLCDKVTLYESSANFTRPRIHLMLIEHSLDFFQLQKCNRFTYGPLPIVAVVVEYIFKLFSAL